MEDRTQIRPIRKSDNSFIASIIRETLLEFGAPIEGTAYSDPKTFPNMTAAIRRYEKNGFHRIDAPIGNTCHYDCNVWMLKEL